MSNFTYKEKDVLFSYLEILISLQLVALNEITGKERIKTIRDIKKELGYE